MGKAVKRLASERDDIHIAAEIDKNGSFSLSEIGRFKDADCAIDFSSHLISCEVCERCSEISLPLVMGTTGHTQSEISCIERTAEKIPVFFSENMSFYMLLMRGFVRRCAEMTGEFDALITETHRKGKADTPSKTALMLKNEISAHSHGRVSPEIFSVRKDNCAGKHEIVFFGEDEEISLTHTCFDRIAYARGAFEAAKFIVTKKNGLFSSDSLIYI